MAASEDAGGNEYSSSMRELGRTRRIPGPIPIAFASSCRLRRKDANGFKEGCWFLGVPNLRSPVTSEKREFRGLVTELQDNCALT